MTSCLDASVLVPLVVFEPNSPVTQRWFATLAARSGFSSRWAFVEVASAIGNRVRRRDLTTGQGKAALVALGRSVVGKLGSVDVLPEDFEFAQRAITRFDLGLRAGDAVHVAVALRIDALVLMTFDLRLANAARAFGLDAAEPQPS